MRTGTLKSSNAFKRTCCSILQHWRASRRSANEQRRVWCRWAATTVTCSGAGLWLSNRCGRRPFPTVSRFAPHLAEHNRQHGNMTSAMIWHSNICDRFDASSQRMTPFTFNTYIYVYSFSSRGQLYRLMESGWVWGGAVWNGHQLEQMSSILWCFWEISAVKRLKYSHWCCLFHLLWKSRSNCRCLKELIFHVRSWQWTSGSLRRYNESSSVIPLTSASQSEDLWFIL